MHIDDDDDGVDGAVMHCCRHHLNTEYIRINLCHDKVQSQYGMN